MTGLGLILFFVIIYIALTSTVFVVTMSSLFVKSNEFILRYSPHIYFKDRTDSDSLLDRFDHKDAKLKSMLMAVDSTKLFLCFFSSWHRLLVTRV